MSSKEGKPRKRRQWSKFTKRHLLEQFDLMLDALQRHDFDIYNDAWQNYDSTVVLDAQIPSLNGMVHINEEMPRWEYVQKHEQFFTMNPDVKFIVKSRTADVDTRNGRARIAVYVEFDPTPDGITFQTAVDLYWHLVDGKWLLYKVVHVQGIDCLGLDGM